MQFFCHLQVRFYYSGFDLSLASSALHGISYVWRWSDILERRGRKHLSISYAGSARIQPSQAKYSHTCSWGCLFHIWIQPLRDKMSQCFTEKKKGFESRIYCTLWISHHIQQIGRKIYAHKSQQFRIERKEEDYDSIPNEAKNGVWDLISAIIIWSHQSSCNWTI